MSSLAKDELDRIYKSPISPARKSSFLERFLSDRETAGTVEMLFERVNAFQHVTRRPRPEEVPWTGFSALVFKGPFVDLPNWAPLGSWAFAVAMERRLLEGLDHALREATAERIGDPTNRDAVSVLRAFDRLGNDLTQRGHASSLLVLAGPLGTQLAVDLQQTIAGAWRDDVKRALRTTFRIMGMHGGIPILDIPESPSPGVYAVDLARFARLTRYGDEPEFAIEEITPERARDLLAEDPKRASSAHGDVAQDDDPVRDLQMKVALKLFETYELTVLDKDAAAGTPLIGPVLEWEPNR